MLGNLEAALSEEPRPRADRKLSGEEEALLVATACSRPPEGRARWTLELLADEMVKLTEHDNIFRETGRRVPGAGNRPALLLQCTSAFWCGSLPVVRSGRQRRTSMAGAPE